MLYKVIGLELKSRPFRNDPYEWDSNVVDKSFGTIGVVLRPLTNEELKEHLEHAPPTHTTLAREAAQESPKLF